MTLFTQMESYLVNQIEKCDHYRKYFENQDNTTMANKFATYSIDATKNLEILRQTEKNQEGLPKFKFEHISFIGLPTNVDIDERELKIFVKTSGLSNNDEQIMTYIVAEFDFPYGKQDTLVNALSRRFNQAKIEPGGIVCCSVKQTKQLDIVYSTNEKSFTNPDDGYTLYDRPLSFYVDKGKSRTHKRKFKPVKLTVYQRRGLLRFDKKLGTVRVKIDGINDDCTLMVRLPITGLGLNTTISEPVVEVRVRVREPLVDKSIRVHEEKILILI